MSGSSRYVLDSNPFIEAKNRYYGFELCPGFWKGLILQHNNDRVYSIDRVLDELTDAGDELSDWAKEDAPKTFFKKTQDRAVIEMFQRMTTWVNAQPQFSPAARMEFASVADGWVMAYAKVNKLSVVTHEEFASQAQKKVPMPNVCLEFDIEYVNTFDMLKDLNVKFVLHTKTR